jgi:hypothetical protein
VGFGFLFQTEKKVAGNEKSPDAVQQQQQQQGGLLMWLKKI